MKEEQKQELINEIVGILHLHAGTMYDAELNGEPYISLTEDYFEDVAERAYIHIKGVLEIQNPKV